MTTGERELTDAECDEMLERALQFSMLGLPGQPQGMHMGTAYLVNDLARAVRTLRQAAIAAQPERARAVPLDCALRNLLDAAGEAQCGCTLRQRDSGHLVGCWMPALKDALEAYAAPVALPAQPERAREALLEEALVHTAFGLHGTPQYMLCAGVALLDNDQVRVTLPDGRQVQTSRYPPRAAPVALPDGDS